MTCFRVRHPLFLQCFLVLSVLVSAAAFTSVSAQDSLRKVVYGETPTTKKKAPVRKKAEKKAVSKPSTTEKKSARGTNRKKTSGNDSSARRSVAPPGWVNVVFESKPNTHILLNGNHVGATDETGIFRRTMTPGLYRITATRGIDIIFPEQSVLIGNDGSNVKLFQKVAAKIPEKKPEPLVIPKTQAEIEMDIAREMSARVIEIFSAYLDPKTTTKVTIEDWQFAADAAVLGEFQNLSKQQIEAQRKFASGQLNLAEKNYQKAFVDFRTAVQSFMGSPLPHIGLGDTYFALAQWQDARRAYEQARTVGPNLWMVHRRLGDIYRKLGEEKKAVQSYADAIRTGDDRYETKFLRVRSMVDAKQMETAIPQLEELAKETPRSEIYLALGEAYESLKRDVGALDHYRKAVELNPESSVAQYRLARIYYDQREYKKAVTAFETALKLDGAKKSFPHNDAAEKRSIAISRIKTSR